MLVKELIVYSPPCCCHPYSIIHDPWDDYHVTDLEVVQPLWLVMVLGGEDAGVEEHEGHDQPEHPLALADVAALPTH